VHAQYLDVRLKQNQLNIDHSQLLYTNIIRLPYISIIFQALKKQHMTNDSATCNSVTAV